MRKNSTKEIITSAWISCQRHIFCLNPHGDSKVKGRRCFGLESIRDKGKADRTAPTASAMGKKPTTKARRLLPRARHDLSLKTPSACL